MKFPPRPSLTRPSIAAITLTRFSLRSGARTPVGGERLSYVIAFLELAFSVAPHISLIALRGD
jgi:hypothetical protein